jgi:hypothetical protein
LTGVLVVVRTVTEPHPGNLNQVVSEPSGVVFAATIS